MPEIAVRWKDHILGPDTTANRPDPSTVPEHALYADDDDGVLYINIGGTWTTYRAPATGLSDPTTTLGDILVRGSSAVSRLGVGTDGQVLTADSGEVTGIKWDTPTTGGLTDPTTTKGDLLVRDSTSVGRFAAGSDGTVLMYDSAQTAGVKSKALDDSDVAPVAPNDQTGTTYTFVLADGRRLVTASNSSAQTYTVPPNSSVAYPIGTALQIIQKGTGQVTLAPGSGVTLNQAHGLKTSAQWAVITVMKIATDTWVVTGDTTT